MKLSKNFKGKITLTKKKEEADLKLESTKSIFDDESDDCNSDGISIQVDNSKHAIIPLKNTSYSSNLKKDSPVDPNIFDYDAAYDDIVKQREIEKTEKENRKRKTLGDDFVSDLQEQTELRKAERLIFRNRLIARNIEKEDSIYNNSIRIVTGAYKRKLEEDKQMLSRLGYQGSDKLLSTVVVTGTSFDNNSHLSDNSVDNIKPSLPDLDNESENVTIIDSSTVTTISDLMSISSDSKDDNGKDDKKKQNGIQESLLSAKERYLKRKNKLV